MIRSIFLSFMFVILATGCESLKYVPNIARTQGGPMLEAIAELHDLYPTYVLLSGMESFGLDAPKTERIEPSELTRQVENELLQSLDAAGVFSRVTRFDPYPDVLLSG